MKLDPLLSEKTNKREIQETRPRLIFTRNFITSFEKELKRNSNLNLIGTCLSRSSPTPSSHVIKTWLRQLMVFNRSLKVGGVVWLLPVWKQRFSGICKRTVIGHSRFWSILDIHQAAILNPGTHWVLVSAAIECNAISSRMAVNGLITIPELVRTLVAC